MKLQEIRLKAGIEQAELAKKVGTNAPMMSNFEHYRSLPIPTMLKAMCRELNCEILDIYNKEEIYIAAKNSSSDKKESECYRLTADLPNSARTVFSSENLKKCGYKSLKDFIWHCYKWLEKKQQKQKKSIKQSECSMDYENDIAPLL